MNKLVALVLLVVGVVLIAYGVGASNSVGSGLSRLFTGSPTDKTLWLTLGGICATVMGLTGLLRGSNSR